MTQPIQAPQPQPPTQALLGGSPQPVPAPAPTLRARPELPAYGLGALAIVVIGVLAGLGHPIPTVLEVVAGGAVGGGLGVTRPSAS